MFVIFIDLAVHYFIYIMIAEKGQLEILGGKHLLSQEEKESGGDTQDNVILKILLTDRAQQKTYFGLMSFFFVSQGMLNKHL